MKKILLLLCCLSGIKSWAQTFSKQQYHSDFNFFWQTMNDNYCYFQKKQIDWQKIKPIYDAQIDTVSSRSGFVSTMERALYEIYDHHAGLNTNNKTSRRLVPTSTDIWAEYINDKPIILELRKGFGCESVGIRAGMEVLAINDIPVANAILPYLGRTVNAESKSFALRLALAGDHLTERKITLKNKGRIIEFYPDKNGFMLEHITYPSMVEVKTLPCNIGYLKINNYLFDNALIAKFDSALNTLIQTKALIVDLRETASGGNTAVARAILGRFIKKEQFYQKHELYAEEKETGIKRSWEEIVSPRGKIYTKSMVILADHWTGSISEGITIAFDGMKRAKVIGTELARLNGAVYSFEMPETKIGFNIPVERLYHVNGKPREFFEPAIKVNVESQKPGRDLIMLAALRYLKNIIK